MDLIELDRIRKVYSLGEVQVEALKEVSLNIRQGEFVALVGPSGSGKSTLMNTLGCLDRPTSGSYKLAGQEIATLSRDGRAVVRNQRIGFVFQNFNLLSRTSAIENVELPMLYSKGTSAGQRRKRAIELLELVGLGSRLDHHPGQLSGGQQQRVAIARSLANNPAILMCDEPTGNLDTKTSKEVIQLFLKAPQHVLVEASSALAVVLEERAYLVPQEQKGPFLRELLAREAWPQVLVFVASGRRADNVVRKLGNSGIRALSLHGDKSMSARTDALDQFRSGRLRILVATDLIARGIDISGLACVIHYDLPWSPKDYVHRSGRTGRAGLGGVAISLVGPEEEAHLAVIEKKVGRRFGREGVKA